jgi:hypothetical protein
MSQFAARLYSAIAKELTRQFDVPLKAANDSLRIEAIEQIVVGVEVGQVRGKRQPRAINAHGLMVRTIEPFDWAQQIRAWWPSVREVRDAGRVYYKLTCPQLAPNPCFYLPDDRTIVLDDEEPLLRIIRRGAPATSPYAQGPDWERVSRGLLVVALDNRAGRWTQEMQGSGAQTLGLPIVDWVDRWIFGVADADNLACQAIATCADDHGTEATARAVDSLLDAARRLVPPGPDERAELRAMAQLLSGLVANSCVEREGRTVVLRSTGFGKIADVITTLLPAGGVL